MNATLPPETLSLESAKLLLASPAAMPPGHYKQHPGGLWEMIPPEDYEQLLAWITHRPVQFEGFRVKTVRGPLPEVAL